MDDKAAKILEKNQENHSDAESQQDWTVEEEKVLVRKIDAIVMPLLILGFFGLQLDRGNIGNALTDSFLVDVGITQYQFNVGNQLLALGIVLLEIPSSMVLYRVGPSYWIGGQIIAWGFVATFQAFQKGYGAYLATRILLGLLEAGFIPGGLYTITRWYKKNETSKRFSYFFIGNMFAGGCSGLVAFGVLRMRGIANLTGWQWLFLIEGIFTVLVGILFVGLFPNHVGSTKSIIGIRYFTERESYILARRVILDDPSKRYAKPHVTREEMKRTFTNWRLIPHVLLTISGLAPSSTMGAYAPSLVNSMGYGKLKANAMVSIGSWMLLVANITWGIVADKLRLRGPVTSLGILLFWGFVLGNRLLVFSDNYHAKFAVLVLAIAFSANWHPVNGSWMSMNTQSAGERSITMAILIMSANASGIIGSQLFQAQDAPFYRTGWTAILGLVSFSLLCSIVANAQYYVLNHRRNGDGRVYTY